MNIIETDVLIIGAGPSGSVAAGILRTKSKTPIDVLILEKSTFPRFSIGESLLPQSMAFIEEAGMLQAVVDYGFQFKNGAQFSYQGQRTHFDFREKFSSGWGTTFQVQRADFDQVLIKEAEKQGAIIKFRQEVISYEYDAALKKCIVTVCNHENDEKYQVKANFVLDASGFARVFPRLLNLESPSTLPVRQAIFTHIEDNISDKTFDRNKILITVHPSHIDVWYWLIPFSNGRCSFGVVAESTFFKKIEGASYDEKLKNLVHQDDYLSHLLSNANWPIPVQTIIGYSANVKSLVGQGYALLGNAGEFLDPVFSSGITIAVKSASLAANCLIQEREGNPVDWNEDFEQPLRLGVDVFRTYVEAWYEGKFQDIVFSKRQQTDIRNMLSSILAGYAWDVDNPFVYQSKRRLMALHELLTT
ncbi:NAD(P)/FAD-dependent oxidoreductase [Hydromonas duriensis]|uniref:Flavin-dependent dehydrogenase n=1 Tax=Hydromonas duriensis TaxID=1527608 RepID=A0A4R6Y728_9BURK|nr:NAD(P)/FAD-dependent oxidoreductase [Hydromonas duriensis]TDR30736.1 flavin-dependent dehydrogenase [Hydromonas duriensis]